MAPSVADAGRNNSISTRNNSASTSASPAESKTDAQLVTTFKSDLTTIRGFVTCTICDQLLYEPWTLGCGHTYCYGCLCQWFKQHQHRKTCPDCRTAVKTMPAPSFTIKQMIEIFITRKELMPDDETEEQHRKNIEEERVAVEKDKTTEEGLFKGCFKHSNRVHPQWVEEDGIYVCSGCLHEWIAGERRCGNCHILCEDHDGEDAEFSGDMDSFDGDHHELYDMEVDDDESEDSEGDSSDRDDMYAGLPGGYAVAGGALQRLGGALHFHGHPHHIIDLNSDDSDGEGEIDMDDDEDDEGSLRDFIDSDRPMRGLDVDGPSRAVSESTHITVSSDDEASEESDDSDDEIVVRRARGTNRGFRRAQIPSVSSSSDPNESDSSASTSRRVASTSSGAPGQEDDVSGVNYGYSPLQETDDSSEGSTSDTIQELDRDDRLRLRESSTPRHSRAPSSSSQRSSNDGPPSPYGQSYDDNSDDEVEQFDGDGDVEMSVSPDSRQTSVLSEDSPSEKSSRRTSRFSSEDLGPAAVIHEEEDDDSEDSVRPAVRRRRRHALNRISATHDDEDVTLTQLFTRPPTGRRTSPTFDSHRIIQWYASMRGSSTGQPPISNSSLYSHRPELPPVSYLPRASSSRGTYQMPGRADTGRYRGVRGRNFTE